MKKLFLLLIIFGNSYSQPVKFSDYFNLNIGNIYVYNCTRWLAVPPPCNDLWKMRIEITDTIRYNGKKYYSYSRDLIHITGTCEFHSFMFPFYVGTINAIRLDTLTGNIYYYNTSSPCGYSPNETMIDSLNSKLNDAVRIQCVPSPYYYNCVDTAGNKKYYIVDGWANHTLRREYIRGVGLVNNYYYKLQSGISGSSEQTLVGRVINGIVYGDTAFLTVGVTKQTTGGPSTFSLSQNYPNPFNPITKIKYSLPSPRWTSGQAPSKGGAWNVRLIIYDILGREVETLIPPPGGGQEGLKPGSYEVTWDGSRYASGVYFYRLYVDDASSPQANPLSITKKMVLIK